ncbi:Bug family tripartite tricarboxylate transporter substrate binding protein [Polynucleobacter necessarius]|uniref:Bug family tripartite tricarboxylate transporter substrate binding protein n=1 Tax=Polynucleobacter necessarius TaxID=576610 RepID=UPI0022B26CBC|nr:tripartite tricarboxylate transporter substrate-binding protein [Polynucleobacter necessarius]
MRSKLKTALLCVLCVPAFLVTTTLAQNYPSKTITIVVPTAPGGANDAMARILAQGPSQKMGQPVIVDNKPVANGAIATEFVARAAPDGYTILFGYIATHGINPALQKLKYDPIADFGPIGIGCKFSNAVSGYKQFAREQR